MGGACFPPGNTSGCVCTQTQVLDKIHLMMATLAPLCRCVAVLLLLLALIHQPGALAASEYARKVSYQDQIVVRCPDRNKATVQVLRDHTDVWNTGKESIDVRISKQAYARVQKYFPECTVLVQDLEAHVQEAERRMFPKKRVEQEAWIQSVVEAVVPNGDLKQCEEKRAEIQRALAMDESWFAEYHDYDAIVEWYQQLKEEKPDLVRYVPSIGKTLEGRDMPAVHFTGTTSNPDKKKFWIQCQIHAREWISGAVCMYIAKYFVDSYNVVPQITDLMNNLEFVLVPFVNPDGYAYTWTNDRMWRKNRNHNPPNTTCVGVDINRNYPVGFKYKADSCADDYGGPEALSELETQHVTSYFKANPQIIGSIDFHSYGQLLLRPWGHTNATAPDEAFHSNLANEMIDIIRDVHGMEYTSEHSYDLYYCYGIAADWLYSEDAAANNGGYRSASFCIELRDKTGQYEFMLPADEIIPTAEEIVPAVVHYMEAIWANPIEYTPPPSTANVNSAFWDAARRILKQSYRRGG